MNSPNAKPAIWFGLGCPHHEKWVAFVVNFHHDGESHRCCRSCIRERVEGILNGDKPEEEWGPRMEAMGVVLLTPQIQNDLDKWRAKQDAINAKWQAKRDAVNAKWQAEWDAVYAKWWSEWVAVDAKYAALLPTPIPVEPWLCEEL